MDKAIVNVFVPAVGQKFDVMIPRNMRISEITPMLARALEDVSGGSFIASNDVALCDGNTGALLNVNITADELGLKNGSKLMII